MNVELLQKHGIVVSPSDIPWEKDKKTFSINNQSLRPTIADIEKYLPAVANVSFFQMFNRFENKAIVKDSEQQFPYTENVIMLLDKTDTIIRESLSTQDPIKATLTAPIKSQIEDVRHTILDIYQPITQARWKRANSYQELLLKLVAHPENEIFKMFVNWATASGPYKSKGRQTGSTTKFLSLGESTGRIIQTNNNRIIRDSNYS